MLLWDSSIPELLSGNSHKYQGLMAQLIFKRYACWVDVRHCIKLVWILILKSDVGPFYIVLLLSIHNCCVDPARAFRYRNIMLPMTGRQREGQNDMFVCDCCITWGCTGLAGKLAMLTKPNESSLQMGFHSPTRKMQANVWATKFISKNVIISFSWFPHDTKKCVPSSTIVRLREMIWDVLILKYHHSLRHVTCS